MAMTSGLFILNWRDLMDTSALDVDWLDPTNIVCLFTDSFTAADLYGITAHAGLDGEVAAGGGYTQHAKQVGGTPTLALDGTEYLKYSWSAAVEWTSSTISAEGMVISKETTTEPLIAVDFGTTYASTNGTFSISAHANGIWRIDMLP